MKAQTLRTYVTAAQRALSDGDSEAAAREPRLLDQMLAEQITQKAPRKKGR